MKNLSIGVALAVAVLTPVAALADAPPLTITIPVTLKNIDRDFDEFTVDCQLQYSAAYSGSQFANGITQVQKLVNRGFSGTVTVFWLDPKPVQAASQAICLLNFHSSTDPSKNFEPDQGITNAPSAAFPLAGTPRSTKIIVKLP